MAVIDSITQARQKGASDDQIVQEILKQNPAKAATFQKAQSMGANSTHILDEILKQNGAVAPQAPVVPTEQPSLLSRIGSGIVGVGKAVGNALTSNEQALGTTIGNTIATGQATDTANQSIQADTQTALKFLQTISADEKAGKDTSHLKQVYTQWKANQPNGSALPELPTIGQAAGQLAGVALDVLSAGSYGDAAKGAESGKLLTSSANKLALAPGEAIASNIVGQTVKQGVGQTIKNIATKTAIKAGIGAGTGYAYDVSQNLQSGKTGLEAAKPGMGTILGGTIPAVIGATQAGMAVTKNTAPKFINSLIKPKQADFSYSKDPGKTVSEMGITGNTINGFADNIHTAKQDVGSKIGDIYSSPQNSKVRIDATPEIAKLDAAIQTAAKGGKENQGIVTTLQNTKDALLYEHKVNADGVIEKVGTARDLSNLNPKEAFDLKKVVAEQTKFTGKPSDDKTVNSVLKSIYGGIKEKLNDGVGVNNPEITKLNEQYAGLTSAELATRNREAILKRADVVSMPIRVGAAGALISALATGGAAIPVILSGVGAAAFDKALESTAVKTRMASWLGSQSPSAITKLIQQNPAIKTTIYRLVPKLASQLGQTTNVPVSQQQQTLGGNISSPNPTTLSPQVKRLLNMGQ